MPLTQTWSKAALDLGELVKGCFYNSLNMPFFAPRFFDRKIHTSWKWGIIINQSCKIGYFSLIWVLKCIRWFFMDFLKVAKIKSWQNWKLPKLKVAQVESCKNWKLLKLSSAFLAKLPNYQIAKLPNCQVQNCQVQNCQVASC